MGTGCLVVWFLGSGQHSYGGLYYATPFCEGLGAGFSKENKE